MEARILWQNKAVTLRVIGFSPQEGDTIVGISYDKFYDLTEKLPALIMYKIKSDETMARQENVINNQNAKIENLEQITNNLEQMNKNTKRTWLKRSLGIGIGGVSLGVTVGLLIPVIIN